MLLPEEVDGQETCLLLHLQGLPLGTVTSATLISIHTSGWELQQDRSAAGMPLGKGLLLQAVRAVTASATMAAFSREPRSVLTRTRSSSGGCGAPGSSSRHDRSWRSPSPRPWRSCPYPDGFWGTQGSWRKFGAYGAVLPPLTLYRVWGQFQLCRGWRWVPSLQPNSHPQGRAFLQSGSPFRFHLAPPSPLRMCRESPFSPYWALPVSIPAHRVDTPPHVHFKFLKYGPNTVDL